MLLGLDWCRSLFAKGINFAMVNDGGEISYTYGMTKHWSGLQVEVSSVSELLSESTTSKLGTN